MIAGTNFQHPLLKKFEVELEKVRAQATHYQQQTLSTKESIEKVVNMINFESKLHEIPEDKKFMKIVTKCFEAIEKTYRELDEAMITKIRNFPKIPAFVQKFDQKYEIDIRNQKEEKEKKKN